MSKNKVKDIVFSEAHKDFDPSKLPPDLQLVLKASEASAVREFASPSRQIIAASSDDFKAAYKVEVFFGPRRSSQRDTNSCFISVHESGKHLSGEGDDMMYWCKDKRQDSELGCGGPVPSGAIIQGHAYCPHCGRIVNAQLMTTHYLFRNSAMRKIVDFVERTFHALKDNADIYVKYDRTDPRYLIMQDELGVERADELMGLTVYTLDRIMRDLATGSTLSKRLWALLTS